MGRLSRAACRSRRASRSSPACSGLALCAGPTPLPPATSEGRADIAAVDEADAAGGRRRGIVAVGTDVEHVDAGRRRVAAQAPRRRVGHGRACTRTTPGAAASTALRRRCSTDPKVVGRRRVRPRLPLRPLAPATCSARSFAAQIALAHEHDLALVIHTREAWDDTFAILAAEGVPERTVFHCFTGGPDEAGGPRPSAPTCRFSGIVTFKTRGRPARRGRVLCPLDRLLVETDSPFLAPSRTGESRTGPAWVPVVGAAVAACQG